MLLFLLRENWDINAGKISHFGFFAGSGSDHLPNAEKERGNTGLGEHHRATKRPCCDEESGGGHHLHRCAGDSPSNCPAGVVWTSVTIYTGSARMRNVICATVGKQVGCSFKYGVYGRVFKIRPVQDSAVWYRRKWSNKLVVLPLVVATDARHCRHRTRVWSISSFL